MHTTIHYMCATSQACPKARPQLARRHTLGLGLCLWLGLGLGLAIGPGLGLGWGGAVSSVGRRCELSRAALRARRGGAILMSPARRPRHEPSGAAPRARRGGAASSAETRPWPVWRSMPRPWLGRGCRWCSVVGKIILLNQYSLCHHHSPNH